MARERICDLAAMGVYGVGVAVVLGAMLGAVTWIISTWS